MNLIALGVLLAGIACGPDREVFRGDARFRAAGDNFEISRDRGHTWERFFPRGVNLAIAVPGRFPGELFASLADYERWLGLIAAMNCNVVRTYTLHHPPFYAALGRYNSANPDRPLYLVQGIWLDELEHGDYMTDASEQLAEEIAHVVDAIHGEARIPERRGKAWGDFRYDVSAWTMAWLPGHEMDGDIVAQSNELWAEYTRYDGRHVSSPEGLPIESWVARALDFTVTYELERHGAQRPVGWSNWPALDPIPHPTETERFGQDVVDVDFAGFATHAPFEAGLFASYHVYPFNPEFIIYDPGYREARDAAGRVDSYLGYLRDLKAHHPGVPLFITEYGLPSSFGVAHVNDTAGDHGGYTEVEQAEHVVALYEAIRAAGAAGAVLFELIDEWFKRTWMTNPTTLPAERAPLWYDVLNPEQSFGALAYYPLPDSITVDGRVDDWPVGSALGEQQGAALARAADDRDPGRTITAVHAAADPAFLFLRIDVAGGETFDLDHTVWIVGLSTLDGATGDRRLPELDLELPAGHGFEAAVILDGAQDTFELRIDETYDVSRRLNGESRSGGEPLPNADGRYVLTSWIINHNEAYIAAGKAVIPEIRRYEPGRLRRGDSRSDTLAHFQAGRRVLELRLPWHALWVTDPSSRQVLADDPATEELDTRQTAGVRVIVLSAVRRADGLHLVDALPRAAVQGSALAGDALPLFSWDTWDEIAVPPERPKPLYYAIADAYAGAP